MVKTKPDADVDAAEAAPEEQAAAADKPAKASKTEIVVKHRDHKGEVVARTFSKEVHGADFATKAEEFKATNADKIVPDDTPTA